MQFFTLRALYASVFLLFCTCFSLQAQDKPDTISRDYVINLKGDTIKGPVLWVSDASLKMDPYSQTHTVKYKAADVKEARKSGDIYIPIKASLMFHDVIFGKRIEHGALDLFSYYRESTNQYGTASQTIWYAAKAGGSAAEIKTTGIGNMSRAERKKNFMTLISDDEALSKEFDSKSDYSFDYLEDVIRRYNQQAAAKK